MSGKYLDNEIKAGEEFCFNVRIDDMPNQNLSDEGLKAKYPLKTIRLGKQALDVRGGKLDNNYRPVFIHKSESEALDRILTGKP